MAPPLRYRFAGFTVSPRRRQLLRGSEEVPLIPRYLDLLLVLLQRRHEAVARRDIMDAVWTDVVVSDGALSQAVRTLRRALGDLSRESAFIRTVSRHGYRFVYEDVIEEPDDVPLPAAAASAPVPPPADALEALLSRLLQPGGGAEAEADRREAAEALHVLGTAEALARLDGRPGHARARAMLRDARWDVPRAGDVPLLTAPGAAASIAWLVRLRLTHAVRLAGLRWSSASAGGALAGILGGALGGLILLSAPGSDAPRSIVITLAGVGALVGGLGAAGVGAGLAMAEALARSARTLALVGCGALGGGAVGALFHAAASAALLGLFGQPFGQAGGGAEGWVLGAAAGLGYALATPTPGGGMAAPRGRARARAALATGLACALAGIALTAAGGHLCAASLNLLAHAFAGSHVGLAPIARLLGEREMGPVTRAVLGGAESLLFGGGLALGLTHRPR